MTPDEYRQATLSILELLIEKELVWVVREIETVFREGRLVTKNPKKTTGVSASVKPSKAGSLLGSEEYSPKDAFTIVIAAVERALVDTADIEVAIATSLRDFQVDVSSITFAPPVSGIQTEVDSGSFERHEFTFSRSAERLNDVQALRDIIRRFRPMEALDVE